MGTVLHDDICRYMKQAERISLWGEPIPGGMVLASSCLIQYCRHREHMVLRPNKSAGDRDYKEIRSRAKALAVGEYFDLPDELNDVKSRGKFVAGLLSGIGDVHLLFRSIGDTGIRIIRYGDFYQDVKEFKEAFPVTDVGPTMGVWLNCQRCGEPFLVEPCKEEERMFCGRDCTWRARIVPYAGLRPGCFYLGFMRPPMQEPVMHPVNKCSVKACIFPVNGNGKGLCHRHGHFFDYASSMQGHFDMGDIYPKEGQQHAVFSTGWIGEEATAYTHIKHVYRGEYDHGRKKSDEWWNQHVIAAQPKASAGIHHGIGGLHHGKRKKKRPGKRSQKAKRKAALENRQGHAHPSKKPRERFERESIADIPMWTPPAKRINEDFAGPMYYRELETVVDDDEYEREMAMAELSRMDGEFEEAFAE